MYIDNSPVPNFPPTEDNKVLVIDGGEDAQEVMRVAPTSIDESGKTIYWIVFADEPRRVWDFTDGTILGAAERRVN